jgi:MoaA/NifB/PqqE/SkfB family radical SAM enzyme
MFPKKHLDKIDHFDICGTWGDPIMNKDIFKIVEYIMQNTESTTVLINTNGSFRNENWWWELGLLGKERIKVMWAVEGVTQEQHSLYRQSTNLETVLSNMESFSLAGGISEIFTVVFKHNENHLLEIAKLTKQHGAKCIMFIQSNRFYNNMKFDFINEAGESKVLERAEKENSAFYGATFNLHDSEHLERIKNESIK